MTGGDEIDLAEVRGPLILFWLLGMPIAWFGAWHWAVSQVGEQSLGLATSP